MSDALHVWRGAAATGGPWQPVDWCDPHAGAVLAADSWRVVDGTARGLAHHRERFLGSAAALLGELAEHGTSTQAQAFWDAALELLPTEGDWFPRVELRARGEGAQLSLRVRPTPQTSTAAIVATAPHDPRIQPRIKGPDLDSLQRLRTLVQPAGANEAIILTPTAEVVEGAYSALVWWRDGVLHQVDDVLPRIPSVTERIVIDAAIAEGVPVRAVRAHPIDLAGAELWVLSALHGLRVATAWVGGPGLAIEPGRAERGRAWLEAARRPLFT